MTVRLAAVEGDAGRRSANRRCRRLPVPRGACGRLHVVGAVVWVSRRFASASASTAGRSRFPGSPAGDVDGNGHGDRQQGRCRRTSYRTARRPSQCRGVHAVRLDRRGGNLSRPARFRDVRPRYRQAWFDAGLEGNVLLQARIGVDGRIRERRSGVAGRTPNWKTRRWRRSVSGNFRRPSSIASPSKCGCS